MSVVLEIVEARNVQAKIASSVRSVGGEESLKRALLADHIRSAVYGRAGLGADLNVSLAIHSTRLLNSARKTANLLWPEIAASALTGTNGDVDIPREVLAGLSDLGDLYDTGGGFWVGTPLRFVRSGETTVALGCGPNALVRSVTGNDPICAGIARIVEMRPLEAPTINRSSLTVSEWLGPTEELGAWTKRTFDEHGMHLTSGDQLSANQLEVYAPDFLVHGQKNPWVPCPSIARPIQGLRLCRPMQSHAFVWDRPYYLAKLVAISGELVVQKSVRIEHALTQRLRFGISNSLGCPHVVSASASGDIVELELPMGIPQPEARIASLGWPVAPDSRRLVFYRPIIPLLSEVLGRIAVTINVR